MSQTPHAPHSGPPPAVTPPPPAGGPLDVSKEPEKFLDGRLNSAWLRWSYSTLSLKVMEWAQGKEDMPKGFNIGQAREFLDATAKNAGLDPRHLHDARTDAQIYTDTTRELLAAPETIWERLDAEITSLENGMDQAEKQAKECFFTEGSRARIQMQADEGVIELEERRKKLVRGLLVRVRRLRERARLPFPPGSALKWRTPIEAAHVLRFMVYVGRVGGETDALSIGWHHGQVAGDYWMARNNKNFDLDRLQMEDIKWCGHVVVLPPGMGKTTFAAHAIGLELNNNPRLRIMIGHAQAQKAEENLQYLTAMFDPKDARGRRNRALFPNLPALEQKSSRTMRFALGERQKQPTVSAHGIKAKVSASDADIIWFDDPCDQEIAEQETERKRVFNRINGTWRTRQRRKAGDKKQPFEFITATLWHHADPVARTIQLIRDGKINMRFTRLYCGGPDTKPKFHSIWPEVYPPSALKEIYQKMQNPRLYAATYQSDPQPESMRRIRRLAYYDPADDSHQEFLRNSINYISLDPSATNREQSDHSSFLYAGEGDVPGVDAEGNRTFARRLRILSGYQFHANQTEGVTAALDFAEEHSTHYILVEVGGAFHASVEMFDARGIDVIPMPTGNKSKEIRLLHVASMLDDSVRDKGLPGAVVEFPGKRLEDGTIGADPESPMAWLEDQFLNFGVSKGDHGLDAGTQLCKHCGPSLGVGQGEITRKLQVQRRAPADSRLARSLALYSGPENERQSAAAEDRDFVLGIQTGEGQWLN